ncbi:hypothetical protein BD408DRAFT_204985 [Parasitella parasitica]|nr:hypothetical protein BD408DRAFT_204985 [Parasitella parasitica]
MLLAVMFTFLIPKNFDKQFKKNILYMYIFSIILLHLDNLFPNYGMAFLLFQRKCFVDRPTFYITKQIRSLLFSVGLNRLMPFLWFICISILNNNVQRIDSMNSREHAKYSNLIG